MRERARTDLFGYDGFWKKTCGTLFLLIIIIEIHLFDFFEFSSTARTKKQNKQTQMGEMTHLNSVFIIVKQTARQFAGCILVQVVKEAD